MTVVPYKDQQKGKKQQVAEMFNKISHKYDFLNHFLSLGIDRKWRRKGIKLLAIEKPKYILDIATGTGDLAIESMRLNPDKVIGVDISEGMLKVGNKKIQNKKLDDIITLMVGDSENLQFEDNNFDAVTVAFGVRNFENLNKGLEEMKRVIKPGGKAMIIEFSQPQGFPFKQLYNFYFRAILPNIGRYFSGDSAAYRYLPESVREFPSGKDFLNILKEIGFKNCKCIPLTLGISSIYLAEK